MSQTQSNQTQGEIFEIFTWGSCRRGYLEILYPKPLNLEKVTWKEGEHVVDIGFGKIWYRNHDSRKNLHRDVKFIDVASKIVIRYYGASSCSHSFDTVYLVEKDGEKVVVKELSVKMKAEEVEAENGKMKKLVNKYYVEVDGTEIVVSTVEVSKEVCREKLVLNVKVENDTIYVNGDTYHIKEELKKLKFRWDSAKKMWYMKIENTPIEVIEKIRGLGVNVNVQEA